MSERARGGLIERGRQSKAVVDRVKECLITSMWESEWEKELMSK